MDNKISFGPNKRTVDNIINKSKISGLKMAAWTPLITGFVYFLSDALSLGHYSNLLESLVSGTAVIGYGLFAYKYGIVPDAIRKKLYRTTIYPDSKTVFRENLYLSTVEGKEEEFNYTAIVSVSAEAYDYAHIDDQARLKFTVLKTSEKKGSLTRNNLDIELTEFVTEHVEFPVDIRKRLEPYCLKKVDFEKFLKESLPKYLPE